MSEKELDRIFYKINNCILDNDYDELLELYKGSSEFRYFVNMMKQKDAIIIDCLDRLS